MSIDQNNDLDRAIADYGHAKDQELAKAIEATGGQAYDEKLGDTFKSLKSGLAGLAKVPFAAADALINDKQDNGLIRGGLRGLSSYQQKQHESMSQAQKDYEYDQSKVSGLGDVVKGMAKSPFRSLVVPAAEFAPAMIASGALGAPAATFGAIAASDTYANNIDNPNVSKEDALKGAAVSGVTNALATKAMGFFGEEGAAGKKAIDSMSAAPRTAAQIATPMAGIGAMGAGSQMGENVAQGKDITDDAGKQFMHGAATGMFFGIGHAGFAKGKEAIDDRAQEKAQQPTQNAQEATSKPADVAEPSVATEAPSEPLKTPADILGEAKPEDVAAKPEFKPEETAQKPDETTGTADRKIEEPSVSYDPNEMLRDTGEAPEEAIAQRKLMRKLRSKLSEGDAPSQYAGHPLYEALPDVGKRLADAGVINLHDNHESFFKALNEGVKEDSPDYIRMDGKKNVQAFYNPNDKSIHLKGYDNTPEGIESNFKHEALHAAVDEFAKTNKVQVEQLKTFLTSRFDKIFKEVDGTILNKNAKGLEVAKRMFDAGELSEDDYRHAKKVYTSDSYGHSVAREELAARMVERLDMSDADVRNLPHDERRELSLLRRVYETIKSIFKGEDKQPINEAQAKAIFKSLLISLAEKHEAGQKNNRASYSKLFSEAEESAKAASATESRADDGLRVSGVESTRRALFGGDRSEKWNGFLQDAVDQFKGNRTGGLSGAFMQVNHMVEKFGKILRPSFDMIQRHQSIVQSFTGDASRAFDKIFTNPSSISQNFTDFAARVAPKLGLSVDSVNKAIERYSNSVMSPRERKMFERLINKLQDDSTANRKLEKSEALSMIPDMTDKVWEAYQQKLKLGELMLNRQLGGSLSKIAADILGEKFDPERYLVDFKVGENICRKFDTDRILADVRKANDELHEKRAEEIVKKYDEKIAKIKEEIENVEKHGLTRDYARKVNKAYGDLEDKKKQAIKDNEKDRIRQFEIMQKHVQLHDLGVQNGYTPLMRFGNYGVYLRDVNKEGKTFYAMHSFDTEAKAKQFLRKNTTSKLTPEELQQLGLSVDAGGLIRKAESEMAPDIISLDSLARLLNKTEGKTGIDDLDRMTLMTEALRLSASKEMMRLKQSLNREAVAGWEKDPIKVMAKWVTMTSHESATGMFARHVDRLITEIGKGGDNGDLQTYMQKAWDHTKGSGDTGLLSAGAKNAKAAMSMWMLSTPMSALLNLTSNITNTPPLLMHVLGGDAASAAKIMGQSFALAAKLTPSLLKSGKIDYNKLPDRIAHFVKLAEKEGRLAPIETMSMMAASEGTSMAMQSLGKAMMGLFSKTETFNRLASAIVAGMAAEHLKNNPEQMVKFFEEKGMRMGDRAEADFTNYIIDRTQMLMNSGNTAPFARDSYGSVLYTFKAYSTGMLSLMSTLPAKERLVMLGLLGMTSGLGNMPFEDDILDAIETIAGHLGHPIQVKRQAEKALKDMMGETASQVVMHGLVNKAIGASVDQRIGMANIIPGTRVFDKFDPDAKSNAAKELAGPIAGMATKFIDGMSMISRGEYGGGIAKLSPNVIGSMAQAIKAGNEGSFTDATGAKIMDATPLDVFKKFIGAQPEEIGRFNQLRNDMKSAENIAKGMTQEFAKARFDAMKNKDTKEIMMIAERIKAWNENVDPSMRISPSSISQSAMHLMQNSHKTVEQNIIQHTGSFRKAAARQALNDETED